MLAVLPPAGTGPGEQFFARSVGGGIDGVITVPPLGVGPDGCVSIEISDSQMDEYNLIAQLRNTERKKTRLCKRAANLSNNDLLEVYAMRVHAQQAKDHQITPTAG